METVISFLIGYFFGSFPTAFIVIKQKTGLDITQNGSGNVGAHNSFDVSKSKRIGLLVLFIDLLKGLLTVYLVRLFFGENFLYEMIALIAAVFAHCYSPWIKFKGGRGLATAAGGALIISIPILIIWIVIWTIAFIFRRNIHFANSSATLLSAVLAFTSSNILMKYTTPQPGSELQFSILLVIIFAIILSKHIQPIKEYFISQQNKKLKEQKDESI